ncbi:ABC transporter substrate-binding protein [Paucibacter soli]|uniref:ABC transporter substrate-binding protein n=1 Tax=Paucibacter soli TaxID=3133433 RepID=UPI0030A72D49
MARICKLLLVSLLATTLAQASTLRFCASGSPKTFDPANTDSGIDHVASQPVFDGLLEAERGSGKLIPGLAESWRISADGRQLRFKLRHGVKFHRRPWFTPTRDFNADDVLFTFGRLLDPKHPFQQAYPTISPYVLSLGWGKLISKVERLADDEVAITLASVDASFLSMLSFAFAAMQSAEYGAQLLKAGKAAQIAQLPVGTGPFMFKSFQPDSVLRYQRHPDYFRRDTALVDQLVYAITVDRNVRAQRLRRNECDIAALTSAADVQELAKDPAIVFASAAGLNVGFLAFNLKKPPLDQLAVRQALDMAIDKPTLVRTVFGAAGELAVSTMPRASWAHDATLKPVPYAPEQARELLKRAGVSELNLTLWAMPVQRFYNPNAQLMAQMIQADWAKIGVHSRIVSYEWGEYLKRIDAGEHDTALLGWNGEPEPADTAGQLACGAASASFFCDKAYDEAIQQARQTLDQGRRQQLYAKAQRIAMAQLPWSVIAHGQLTVAVRKHVQGFKLGPDGRLRFDGLTLR